MSSKTVAVTGASGYLAGEIVQALIEHGYTVHGTVRDLSNKAKVQHLQAQFPTMRLFEADLLQPGSFDECFRGCCAVVHAASPFQLTVEDPQRDLVDPAVNGTRNVFDSVVRTPSVKRVVVTSSCAAIASQAPPAEGKVWTEDDWNTDSTLQDGPYRLSKTLAERAAWEYKDRVEVATINPTFILGPPRSKRTDATSIKTVIDMMDGTMSVIPPMSFGVVDVRDVALAHVRALERPDAAGQRFILSSRNALPFPAMAERLKALFPRHPISTTAAGDVTHRPKYDGSRAQRVLGIELTDIDDTLRRMGQALMDLGLVPAL